MNFEKISKKLRLDVLGIAEKKKMAHLGGTYSCVDLLVGLYYGKVLNPNDRFILSKGHACLALYPILVDLGIMDQSTLDSYCDDGGIGTQLDINMPGIDWNTGSLGHALGICCGFALASKLDQSSRKAYVILGDAECAEGSIWEAIIFAGKHRLNNLVSIVDRNRLSVTEELDDDSFFKSYPTILDSLGWNYHEIDGHSFGDIMNTFNKCKSSKLPTMIVANTIKGKGVSFMENKIQWHHGVPSEKDLKTARDELS